jgi:hypothetical protein
VLFILFEVSCVYLGLILFVLGHVVSRKGKFVDSYFGLPFYLINLILEQLWINWVLASQIWCRLLLLGLGMMFSIVEMRRGLWQVQLALSAKICHLRKIGFI